MATRLLIVESEKRLKLEAEEVQSRLIIGQNCSRKVAVHLSRTSRTTERKGKARRRQDVDRKESAIMHASMSSLAGLGAAASPSRSAATFGTSAHNSCDDDDENTAGSSFTPLTNSLRKHRRTLSPIVDVHQEERSRQALALSEAQRLREAHLLNVRMERQQKRADAVGASEEALDHMKMSQAQRQAAVQTFVTKLQRELTARLRSVLTKTDNQNVTPSAGHNHHNTSAVDRDRPFFSSPQPMRCRQMVRLPPIAGTPSPRTSNPPATSVALLDAPSVAAATCQWILRTASNEEDARRMADKAVADIQGEANLEARRQRREAEATKRAQLEEAVARNEMRRAVELAQAQTAGAMRSLVAQRRTVSRCASEAETRLVRLPPCMRQAAATVFSLQDLETRMLHSLEASMKDVHSQRRHTLNATVSHLREQLELALAAQREDHNDVREQIVAAVSAKLDGVVPRQTGRLAQQPESVIARAVGSTFLRHATAAKSSSSMAAAHRQLIVASLKQLHAQIILDKGAREKERLKNIRLEEARNCAGGRGVGKTPTKVDNPKTTSLLVPPPDDDNASTSPSQAVVEALLSAIGSVKRSMSTVPIKHHAEPAPEQAEGRRSKRSRSHPPPRSGRVVPSVDAVEVGQKPTETRSASDTLDLSSIGEPLGITDLAMIRDCLLILRPRIGALRLSEEAVSCGGVSATTTDDGSAVHPIISAAVLEMCMEVPSLVSVDVVSLLPTQSPPAEANGTGDDDAHQQCAIHHHALLKRIVRRNREVVLLRRALRIAQQKVDVGLEQEASDTMALPLLRKRLSESVRMLVALFEHGVKWDFAMVKIRQQEVWESLVIQERCERRRQSAAAAAAARDADAQQRLMDEEQRERLGLDSLYERNVHLVFKESVTLKKSFRRLSRRLSMGVSLRRGFGGGSAATIVDSCESSAAPASSAPTSKTTPPDRAVARSAVPRIPSNADDNVATAMPPADDDEDNETTPVTATSSPTTAPAGPPAPQGASFLHRAAGDVQPAVKRGSSDFGDMALSLRLSPRDSREASTVSNGLNNQDTRRSAAEVLPSASIENDADVPRRPLGSPALETVRGSELAEIDEDMRRHNVHSSSAASRPRQVVFHQQSPPPSRQRMD